MEYEQFKKFVNLASTFGIYMSFDSDYKDDLYAAMYKLERDK